MTPVIFASVADTFLKIGDKLGFETGKFIAQCIIFLVVYTVLNKFAFGPILSLLETRKKRIEEGEANLRKIQADLTNASTTAADLRAKAEEEASRLIKEANASASALRESKTQEAVTEAAEIVRKGKEAAALEAERTMTALKGEFGRMVINATGAITGKVLTSDDQNRINKEALSQLSN